MINLLDRELFQRELQFLKMLKGEVTIDTSHTSVKLEEEIKQLEKTLEESEMQLNDYFHRGGYTHLTYHSIMWQDSLLTYRLIPNHFLL